MRTLLSAIIITLSLSGMLAQNEIGIKAGWNSNSATINGLTPSLTPDVNSYNGWHAGVFFSTPLHQRIDFKPELNVIQKGFGLDASTSVDILGIDLPIGAEAITRIKTVNLQMPLAYSLVENDKVNFYAYAGPTLGYAASANILTRANLIFDINVMTFDLDLSEGNHQRIEAGALAGLGLGIQTGSTGKILLETEYQHGFNSSIRTPLVNVGAVNHSWGVSVGYAINL